MKTTQMIPFERNRYYYGKMLTTPDFRAEQQYMNHKRMFLNQMAFGSGILCGLNVFNLDELSILVESGAAFDSSGREIVVEKSVVRKLSSLEGYQEEKGGKFSLCIRYREEEVQPVYAVSRKENQEEYENNRIREGYELFLVETQLLEQKFQLDSEFFVETRLERSQDYEVLLRMPANVCRGKKVRLSIEIKKLSSREKELKLSCLLQLPVFLTGEGRKLLKIDETISLEKGESRTFDYWLYTPRTTVSETSILIKPEKGKELELKVFLTDEEPDALARRSLAGASLEIRESEENQEFVRLADLLMKQTKTACILEKIEDREVRNYISVPADEEKRARYLSYYMAGEPVEMREPESLEKETGKDEAAETPHRQAKAPAKAETDKEGALPEIVQTEKGTLISGGTFDIPLEQKMKRGTVCFSEEISHGLGPGSVYVAVGIDEVRQGAHVKKQAESTIYGDVSLFSGSQQAKTEVRTAVRVWEEKGSFQTAVSLYGEQNTVLLSLHWIAIKLPARAEQLQTESRQMQITPEEMTVYLRPKEKHYFAVRFHNMEPGGLMYELTEEGSGSIEADGTYTAPVKAGVYEIRISSVEHPEVRTYAYAVVAGRKR